MSAADADSKSTTVNVHRALVGTSGTEAHSNPLLK